MQEQQYWISAIVATYGDPLLNTTDGDEGGFFDALGGFLCVDGSSDKKQTDERRGNTSHAVYDGTGTVLVPTREGGRRDLALGLFTADDARCDHEPRPRNDGVDVSLEDMMTMVDAGAFRFVNSNDVPWRASTMAKGVFVKDLAVTDGWEMQIVRFEPGARFPVHVHERPEFLFILEGELVQAGERLGQDGRASAVLAA